MISIPASLNDPTLHLFGLVARAGPGNNQGPPGGKTPAEFAKEGRFGYPPSLAAAIIFCVLYGIAMVINVAQIVRHRAWFWWVMSLATAMELVGYICRIVSIENFTQKDPFTVQTVMILVAPAVMAAACYMSFGRVVLWVIPVEYQSARHLWVPARRLTPIFTGCDVFSFFVQVIGGAMIASGNTSTAINRGKNVILVGLALQLATFGFFVIAVMRLFVLLRTRLRTVQLPRERNWSLFLAIVNVANIMILIRTILRFIEYVAGTGNYLLVNEWCFYIFDSLPMFVVVVLFIPFHPGHYLPYLGIRRRQLQFSNNADRGPFASLARTDKMPHAMLLMDDRESQL